MLIEMKLFYFSFIYLCHADRIAKCYSVLALSSASVNFVACAVLQPVLRVGAGRETLGTRLAVQVNVISLLRIITISRVISALKMAAFSLRLNIAIEENQQFFENEYGDLSSVVLNRVVIFSM